MSIHASAADDPRQNKLLAALPESDWKRVQRHFEAVELHSGHTLAESHAELRHVYFPTTSTISLGYLTLNGESTEIAAVGNEGLVGVVSFLGGGSMPGRAVVQTAGRAYRVKSDILKEEFRRGGATQRLLLLYAQMRLTLIAQTAVCNVHHSVDQQLSRWLLSTLDRRGSADLTITHELIANILGVRREGITEAVGKLQSAGIIASSRGRITVLNRGALESRCCECYGVVRREYERLLDMGTRD